MRRATSAVFLLLAVGVFLSTLSLRRATRWSSTERPVESHFYPRSPCGERPKFWMICQERQGISIHALLAESDAADISTRREASISIHALLAESDSTPRFTPTASRNFYPRSPCGERRYLINTYHRIFGISIHALLAESDPRKKPLQYAHGQFLSTLSLRRATSCLTFRPDLLFNFYPRSPCGERHLKNTASRCRAYFYPRSPCGERHEHCMIAQF